MPIDRPKPVHVYEEQRQNAAESDQTGDRDGVEVPQIIANHTGKDADGGRRYVRNYRFYSNQGREYGRLVGVRNAAEDYTLFKPRITRIS